MRLAAVLARVDLQSPKFVHMFLLTELGMVEDVVDFASKISTEISLVLAMDPQQENLLSGQTMDTGRCALGFHQ